MGYHEIGPNYFLFIYCSKRSHQPLGYQICISLSTFQNWYLDHLQIFFEPNARI